jgi:hypothetical protein
MYKNLSDAFDVDRMAQKQGQRKGDGAPNYYVVKRHRIGTGLVNVVRRLIAGGALTTTKAGRVLGVKATAVNRLINGTRAA